MENVMLKNKGFTYIIVSIIIIISISALLIINKQGFSENKTDKKQEFLIDNFINEFEVLSNQDLESNDVNNKLEKLFDFIKSHGQNVKFCTIIQDDNYMYFSNYTGESCNLVIDDEIIQEISHKTTIQTDRFINNTNIYLCNCIYTDISGYFLSIYDNENQIIQLKN